MTSHTPSLGAKCEQCQYSTTKGMLYNPTQICPSCEGTALRYIPNKWYRFTGKETFDAGAYHIQIMDKQRHVDIIESNGIDHDIIKTLTAENWVFKISPDYDWEGE